MGVSRSVVSRSLALLKLPESIQDQISRGAISQTQGYELSKISDPTPQAELASLIVSQGLTIEDVAKVIRGSPTKRTSPHKVQTTMVFRVSGCRIVIRKKAGIEPRSLHAALVHLAEEFRQKALATDAA